MAETTKRTVLITGCSNGSLGSALAVALHEAGLQVYATARNPAKMSDLTALGIEILELDPTSAASIAAVSAKISALDILVNNAGAPAIMPVVDIDLAAAKDCFDINVWAYIAMIQAFLPQLRASPHGGVIVNQTSAASVLPIPFQATYNASKAAIAMFSDCMRLELAPFGIRVVELKTALVKSNIVRSTKMDPAEGPKLPAGSIYSPAREMLESVFRGDPFVGQGMEQAVYAQGVVKRLLEEPTPIIIELGEGAEQFALLPAKIGTMDDYMKQITGLGEAEKIIVAQAN